jgi:hypothetical protein
MLRVLDDSSSSDIQWVSVAFGLVVVLVLLDAGFLFVESAAKSRDQDANPRLQNDDELRDIDREFRVMRPARRDMSADEKQRLEGLLMRAGQDADQEQALTFMFGAWVLFEFGFNAFLRTPDAPLQP